MWLSRKVCLKKDTSFCSPGSYTAEKDKLTMKWREGYNRSGLLRERKAVESTGQVKGMPRFRRAACSQEEGQEFPSDPVI